MFSIFVKNQKIKNVKRVCPKIKIKGQKEGKRSKNERK